MSKRSAVDHDTRFRKGFGQLSLVEHALCPLDPRVSLQPNLIHETRYTLMDASRHMQTARVRVCCPFGLSSQDELYLWGLLALTLRQPVPDAELHASPHYCLRELGLIDTRTRRGGRQYQQFREAVDRLSVVRYVNDRFYDPIRAEHRQVSFGFFSYSLPIDSDSSRAWRFYWDPLFFEFARATGGGLGFNIDLYRQLDPATRRLFLLLSKIFPRRMQVLFELQQLAVEVMGLSPTLIRRDQLARTRRCLRRLTSHKVVEMTDAQGIIKRGKDRYAVNITMGSYFRQPASDERPAQSSRSPLVEALREIGLDSAAIRRHLKSFPQPLLREWADITLAARERFGAAFFKRSSAAFFVDNVKKAAQGRRTPPDWWHDIRKAEEARRGQQLRQTLTDPRFKTPVRESTASKSGLSSVAEVLDRLPLHSS